MVKESKNQLLSLIRLGREMTLRQQLHLMVMLSTPAIMAHLSSTLMQYIDAAMVGHLGARATASIGLVESTIWLFAGICSAVATGFYVQVAHHIGANHFIEARNVLRQSLVAVLAFSFCVLLVGVIISESLPFGWAEAKTLPLIRLLIFEYSHFASRFFSWRCWRVACCAAAATFSCPVCSTY